MGINGSPSNGSDDVSELLLLELLEDTDSIPGSELPPMSVCSVLDSTGTLSSGVSAPGLSFFDLAFSFLSFFASSLLKCLSALSDSSIF